ncbi:type 1 glutamine amidotransferase family protein [Neolewinella agarilytica]|uniref:Uncharacterized protein n=2 Tax=Neolewinella agarilytica TaxID=478744 RepID=A0A1H9NGP2_9BACT|nr:hypothetical protein [Neolewinella agarilytica]SER34835.1 hypothetical protein SAMN05444359_13648 [Neolewinella agarilytica]
MPTQEAINIKDYCVRLKYSKEALKEIFIHNVAAMRERELRGKQGDSPFMRFFGFDKIRHVAACDKHGEAQTESVFDFILRHTFHRPREIVMIGKRLYDKFNRTAEVKLPVTDNLIESIREQVNDVAWSEILHGYKQEFILGFRNDYVQQFVTNIVSNAADRSTLLRKVSREATDYLYRVGLLGSIDGKVQRFVPGSTFAFRKERVLPHSGWYVLHPTLDRELQGLGDVKKWYYQHSIIGDECSFETPDVVSWNLNRGYPVDYFRPKKIAGAQDWSGTRIQVDPLALYNGIFINGVRKNKLMRQQHERINESIQFLAVIAQLEAAKAVAGKFNKDMDFRIKTLRNQAMNLRGNTRYSSQITTTDATGLNLFTDRCFGRMVVMGLLLFLRFSIVEARNCVTSFSDKRLANPGEPETAIRFLRRSFFIYGLPGEGRLSSLDKMSILEKASDFERDCLPKWWRDYFLHSLLFNSNYNDEHRRYLREYFEFK